MHGGSFQFFIIVWSLGENSLCLTICKYFGKLVGIFHLKIFLLISWLFFQEMAYLQTHKRIL